MSGNEILSVARLLTIGALVLIVRTAAAQPAPFSFESVIAKAEQSAAAAYVDPSRTIPEQWRRLSYDDYRKITFRNKRALWKGEGLFELEFFHPGFFYDYPVRINIVAKDVATPFPYQSELFDFGDLDAAALGTDAIQGYAGFRVNFPLNSHHGHEFAVFQGASYFRVVGRDQRYGESARGLAVDTAAPGGEEFPIFREFWIERPEAEATTLVVYALLDSRSVAGAYRMILHPGNDTRAEVTAVLFPRREIGKLGIAPLTSMFFYGEDRTRSFDDFRPEVHDSDGLMVHTGAGEWLWRPLVNRQNLTISSFFDDNPRGFGLLQRDRDFTNYQDLEAQYHRRSSFWVQPVGNFGRGRIELVEIPSDQETNDNIVAYFVPERPVAAGQRLEFSYVLTSFLEAAAWPPAGRVEATRIGGASHAAQRQPTDGRLFVLDFGRGELPLLSDAQPVKAVVDVSRGRISEPVVMKNEITKGWRVFFYFYPDGDNSAEFRAFLKVHDRVLTETWNYLWQSQR